ncbi:MAG: alpha-amylase family glycosyl hydrolase [Brevefilum sp.]|nr:alpha-amylase family glycosyl hydrolase [Brevefilum sp.]
MKNQTFFQIFISVLLLTMLVVPLSIQAEAPHLDPNRALAATPPIVDGVVDDSYGPPIGMDPPGDCQGGDPVDLIDLWVTQDETNLYFAFEVNTDLTVNNWGKFVLYVDTTADENGATSDAWGRAVTVADPHKPEYGIYTYLDDGTYGVEDTQVVHWTGIEWDWGTMNQVDAVAIGAGTTSIVEWSVSKAKLGSPDQMWVELWSTGGGGTDNAQDTINFPADDWQASDWGSLATLAVSTPVLQVDGAVEPTYGGALASDTSGDGNGNAPMDLLDLFVSEDASQYYFAYTINDDILVNNWGKYALYVDTTNDGDGGTSDAWGRNVLVNDPHKPEYALYTWVDASPYGIDATQLYAWDGSAWSQVGTVNQAALTGGVPSVIEWAVEKTSFTNPETIWLEVWDTGGGGSENAQDTINDPPDDWNATDWSSTAYLAVSTQYPPADGPVEASHDNDIWWEFLGHDSRDTLYRTPGGPVEAGTPITLRLRAASGDLTEAKLRLYNDRTDTESILPMSIAHDDGTYEWWEAVVPPSPDPTVYWYRFIPVDGTDVDYYEDDAARTGGWGQAFDESLDNSYQLTVYDPAFQTPDWIKNAVVYQVFPDRFRDGDPSNNKPAGTFFYNEAGGTVYRSLTTDWNEEICDPRGTDDCAGTYSKNFYGGDLQGLIEKLDYLQGLGVDTIYLNPIFESPSNHGYDTTDYMAINPMFGTETDFQNLVTALESRQMHLILDGVFNHVSSDSIYFDRYERYDSLGACESQESPYRDWFYFTEVTPGTGPCVGDDGTLGGANYESWWGYDSLPKLNSSNPEVRALVWDNNTTPADTVAGHYMQYADGWRLDVGADVDPGTLNDVTNDYWEGFRNTVKTVNPEAYITGEEWGIANSWLLGGEWDAVMNYQFSSAVLSLWRDEVFTDNDHSSGSSAGTLSPLTPEQFDERMQNLMERYAPEAFSAMLNLFGSHDTSRALFMLDHNTDLNDPAVYEDPQYDWSDAIERLKGAVLVQMTMPGAPTIYYGDEVGLVGPMAFSGGKWEDDPYNRQPYPWLDETGTPFYSHLQTQTSQDELFDYYANLTAVRDAHPALRTGDYRTLLVDNENAIYAYGRNIPGVDAAVVVINRGLTAQDVTLDVLGYLPVGANFEDIFSAASYAVDGSGILNNIAVPANKGVVLVLGDETLSSPPAAIIDLAVTGTSATTVDLSWSASAGADAYDVYRSYLSGGGYSLVGTTPGTSFTDVDLTPGERVYYIVIAKNSVSGLEAQASNEVNALPAYVIGWANLQWPPTINHTIGISPTENIYGQVYIDGVTNLPGATPGLMAQVGFGPVGSDPMGNLDWTWEDAVFNTNAGNNDEFMGKLVPEILGTFAYVYRYSTNGGESWFYADLSGPFTGTPPNPGLLTVNPSLDTTPPSAPILSITGWSASSIDLEWTQSTDDVAVYAYEVYRSTDGMTFSKIDRVFEPDLAYTDGNLETGTLYFYKVLALDTSFNASEFSNLVSQVAEPKLVQLTIEVSVPAFTPGTVFIVGNHESIGNWNPGSVALSHVDATTWTKTIDILDGTSLEFKFTRGNWETVMKGADGNEELSNLTLMVDYGDEGTQLYEYTVLNWRDPIVVDVAPMDGAVDVPVDAGVVTYWSQSMDPSACFTLADSEGDVPGTCSYNDSDHSITFIPDLPLKGGMTYTANAAGLKDGGGDFQQVSKSWSFTTKIFVYILMLIYK